MGHYHNHGQVLDLGVQLHKTRCLRPEAVPETLFGMHLHVQQHHRLLGCARFCRARPERPIKSMVRRFQLRRS